MSITRTPSRLVYLSTVNPTSTAIATRLTGRPVALLPRTADRLPDGTTILMSRGGPSHLSNPAICRKYAAASQANGLNRPTCQVICRKRAVLNATPNRIDVLTPNRVRITRIVTRTNITHANPDASCSHVAPLPRNAHTRVAKQRNS